jgi:hypothetical protein
MEGNSLLHRQVHPALVQNNVVSAQIFTEVISSSLFVPKPDENNQVSVYNGEKYTAEQSFKHYTTEVGLQSAGVLSVTNSECLSVAPLTATEDNHPYDGHAYIDFSGVESKNQIKAKARQLRDIALLRNWTYRK